MSLRSRIGASAFAIRWGTAIALLGGGMAAEQWCGTSLVVVLWLTTSGALLRSLILPLLFPSTTCPSCHRGLPLVGRWKCGDHYTDHRDRHILDFFCSHGHRLEAFDCPRCRATILVQKGEPTRYRHGSAFRLRTMPRGGRADVGILLGYDTRQKAVYLSDERLAWHMAITGGTGRGKSTLLGNMAKQLIEQGRGLTLLDPGGDLARQLLRHIPPEREEDVLFIDLANRLHPFPLNILATRDAVEAGVLVEELLGVFQRLHGDAWGPLLAYQLRMALRAVMAAEGNLSDVLAMFNDGRVRGRVLARVRDESLRQFWTDEFPAIPAVRRTAVVNKLVPIVTHPILGPVLCARSCALDADELIGQSRIAIVNLAAGTPGDDVTTLMGAFLVHRVVAAAYRQSALPPQHRVPHVLMVDEFQRFMHKAAGFDQLLAEARKYRLSLVASNQFAEQLSPVVRAALFGNIGALAAFRVGHRDAAVLTPEFPGAFAEELMELERGQCFLRVNTDWLTVRTLPPPVAEAEDPSDRIVEAMQAIPRADEPPALNGTDVDTPISPPGAEFVQ